MKILNKKLMAVAVAGTLGLGSASVLAEGPSANVSIVSDYVWRGVTQTANTPTVQGGFDWEKDKLSVGVWGSGLDTGGAEFDLYGSYDLGPVSVGLIYYYFMAAGAGTGVYEINVGGDAGPVSLMASYDPDNSLYYVEAGYSYEMSKGTTLDLHVGYGDGYTTASGSAAMDYSVGVSTSAGGLDLSAAYASTDAAADPEGKFFVSVGKSI